MRVWKSDFGFASIPVIAILRKKLRVLFVFGVASATPCVRPALWPRWGLSQVLCFFVDLL
jgi:hypothetical protein